MTVPNYTIELLGGAVGLLAAIHGMILKRFVARLDRVEDKQDRLLDELASLRERLARFD